MMESLWIQLLPIAFFGMWLAVLSFVVVMVRRLVGGVERIAAALERR